MYETASGKCPVEEFLDSLTGQQARKVAWVLELIEELPTVPTNYLKKLVSTDDIWEVRVGAGNNIFRLLGFFDGQKLIVLDHAFQKKDAEDTEAGYKNSRGQKEGLFQEENGMKKLQTYIKERKARDPEFAEGYEAGYQDFKIGAMLKAARKEAGMTQEQVAEKMHTKKTAVSRIENHAQDVKLSTLAKFAQAFGKTLRIEVV